MIRFRPNYYGSFEAVVTDTLNRPAPIKTKYLRANDSPL